MNNKLSRIFQPSMRLYFIVLILFAVATCFFGPKARILAIGEAVIIILLAVFTRMSNTKRADKLLEYIESVTDSMDSAAKDTLVNFPMPVVIFNPSNDLILWSNSKFLEATKGREHFFEVSITDVVPGFSTKWLAEGKTEYPGFVDVGDKKFKVFGSIVRTERETGSREFLATTYWVDMTEYSDIYNEYMDSRPVAAIIMLDNYDELLKNATEKEKSTILASIDEKLNAWCAGSGGHLVKYDRDRYMFIFEECCLQGFIDDKFSVLDSVREIAGPSGVHATLSIGIGRDGKSFEETFRFAALSLEMSLSRGGDQVVIKNRYNFEFYGGQSAELEKRTKVKSRVMANAFGELVSDASIVLIMGHKYADLDSVGSAVGVCCIARNRGKKAYIVINAEKNSSKQLISRMMLLPEYSDVFISPQDAILMADSKTLLVVVDTNRPEQVESDALLLSCNRIAVVDHHRRAATYIQNAGLNFHEPYASSASELVTEMIQYLVDQSAMLRFEAEALLAGIVLDTKSFSIRTGSRTFDAAAFLRRAGADTTEVKKLLQSDLQSALSRYSLISSATVYREGIAIAVSDTPMDRIVVAQAADELLNISGIQASFVLSPDGDSIGISARSIGDINVQVILEKLGGGGNKSTAGAQIQNATTDEVLERLTAAIDSCLEYVRPDEQAI